MAPETLVIQNMGMARWLSQQLARVQGIAANVDFTVPARVVWRIYRLWLPDMTDGDGFDKETLQWKVMKILGEVSAPGHSEGERFRELLRYFEEDPAGVKRFQLAGRIAEVFDRYLVCRTEMLLAWEAGEGADWQAELWRRVVKETPDTHAAALTRRFRDTVAEGAPPADGASERVCIFGLNTLAPLHLHAFEVLSRHAEVHLFFLNPCREYWVDIMDEKAQAHRRARWRAAGAFDFSALLDLGNPLLASMGHTGQGFLDQLLEVCDQPEDLFFPVEEKNLLTGLQRDIFTLTDRRAGPDATGVDPEDDRSVQVHACHSPMREVQVLHDALLEMFDTIPGLTPRDIVVMAPDIEPYAPCVAAVFDAAPKARAIPWSIADRRVEAEEPLVETALALLALPDARLTASEVLAYLENKAVARRFGVDEDGLRCIRMWVEESGIRWGRDGAMRGELGLPEDPANTWAAGLARLFAGYALPPRPLFFGDTFAYPDVEASDAVHLGALQALMDRLGRWRKTLAIPETAAGWQERVGALIDDFFDPEADEGQGLQKLRLQMDTLRETVERVGYDAPLDGHLVRAFLQSRLSTGENARRFLRGGVTFCNMVPMRSIPFRVVCLLGMNVAEFPRIQHVPQFDLIARVPRIGDRFRRNEDRYLFLEALLSARDVFYISYIGNSIQDNSERVPSVVVSELLDYIGKGWRAGDTEALIVRHPLQPFSPSLFDGEDRRLFSYDDRWVAAARVSAAEKPPPFITSALPDSEPEGGVVPLGDFVRFFENPSAWFLDKRLGFVPGDDDTLPEDEEPFSLEALDRYGMKAELLEALMKGNSPETLRKRLRLGGSLPHGRPGDMVFDEAGAEIGVFAGVVRDEMGETPEPVELPELALDLGGMTLRGRIPDLTPRGRYAYRPSGIKAKDRLRLWLYHLALCAAPIENIDRISAHLATNKGKALIFRLAPVEGPDRYLKDLMAIWQRGQTEPLPFFPETSWAYAEARHRAGGEDAVSPSKYLGKWRDTFHGWGDAYDPAVQVAFRGRDPLREKVFKEIAWRVFGPLFAVSSERKVKQ